MPADRGQISDRLRGHRHLRLDHCVGRLGVLGVPGRGQTLHRRCVLDLDLVLQIHVQAAGAARRTVPTNCVGTARWVANAVEQAV